MIRSGSEGMGVYLGGVLVDDDIGGGFRGGGGAVVVDGLVLP